MHVKNVKYSTYALQLYFKISLAKKRSSAEHIWKNELFKFELMQI